MRWRGLHLRDLSKFKPLYDGKTLAGWTTKGNWLPQEDGRTLLMTDTAGLKKESSVQDSVDFYAQRRAEAAIERADVCLLMLDCTSELARGDRKIGKLIEDAVKPVVCVANGAE